ncbi:TonB-dependent receptor [Paucibacter sp. XJ19-41]|uniref:TonB-dependent receptor n=1 Tax=Paucibacter sp. XJ19-41 TaxID=2927824 RepID=UPI00234A96AD|nr:TonB-dependent receptor [Paucibacter sp. XJ19-41]MDC6168722.1 TonB-dependent receptor [Paucibacter sp. XJ19-41]
MRHATAPHKLSAYTPALTPLALAACLALGTGAAAAQPAPPAAKPTALDAVVVTGIRAALEQALNQKRQADGLVEVVTAEDVGKMPDKNVADSIQRLPGINISSAAGGEGGFDENDRVSIRGTTPTLTQTLINGHAIGTGDWFILNQFGSVGRSASFSLLPSELVGKVTVHKSSRADLIEGGTAGTVNVETRKPLEFKKALTVFASAQAVHSDKAGKTDPQLAALVNIKNAAGDLGALFQVFSQTRHVRRDGQEILGYATLDGSAWGHQHVLASKPDLKGVSYPTMIGSSLFQQERKRQGGAFELQGKLGRDLVLGLNGFYSKLDAANYNVNYLARPDRLFDGRAPDPNTPGDTGVNGLAPSKYVVSNGLLSSASWDKTALAVAEVDSIYRPGSKAESSYLNLDGKYQFSDALVLTAQLGRTRGVGETTEEHAYAADLANSGLGYGLNGMKPAHVEFPGANPADFKQTGFNWLWGRQSKSLDSESYGQIDADWTLDRGVLESVKFGARFASHERDVKVPIQARPSLTGVKGAPNWSGGKYPGDFGGGLGGPVLKDLWLLDPAAIRDWSLANRYADPVVRHEWPAEFELKEDTRAGYLMAQLSGSGWRGNVGLRVVKTTQETLINVAGGAKPIVGSAWGKYSQVRSERSYTDYLPSASLRYELDRNLLLRASASRTMTRPDFSALGGSVGLNDDTLTASGGNPQLNPVRSNNFDLSAEWYFAPRSLLSAGVFYMDMGSYVSYGSYKADFFNDKQGVVRSYTVTAPINVSAKNKGLELAVQAPLFGNFGGNANYTYADGEDSAGQDLVGASKHSYNLGAYYEDAKWNARLNYTYRSSFLAGIDRSFAQHMDASGTLSASLSYKFSDQLSFTFDALNLNNPTLKYYGNNKSQLRSLYNSGRQFYFGVRAQF